MTRQDSEVLIARVEQSNDRLERLSLVAMIGVGGWLDEEALGVPAWFLSDGCTKAPDWQFVWGPCRRHDFDYWLGASKEDAKAVRRAADRQFFAHIKANASIDPDGTVVGWWTRRKRIWTAWIYWRGVRRFGNPSFRIRAERLNEFDPELAEIAKAEGKYREVAA